MPWVADYTSRISPAALKAAGVVGVCRYLSYPVPSGKVIGRAEYDELRAAGIKVVLNWEYDDHDWMGGASAGAAHGKEAARQAKALGHPLGSPIPGSGDFDMTWGQWQAAGRGYATNYRNALNDAGYGAGPYGPWDLLTWCRDLGGMDIFWQAGMSTAWSSHRNAAAWPGAHLRQRFKTSVAGHEVDHNDILRSDWFGGGDFMAGLNDAEQQELLRLMRNAERRATAEADTDAPITWPSPWKPNQQPSPNPKAQILAAIKAIPAGGAPTQDQVTTAVAEVMNDASWLAKLGAALASHIKVS